MSATLDRYYEINETISILFEKKSELINRILDHDYDDIDEKYELKDRIMVLESDMDDLKSERDSLGVNLDDDDGSF
jgi:hypothetical protein